jgi:hypothetical protein
VERSVEISGGGAVPNPSGGAVPNPSGGAVPNPSGGAVPNPSGGAVPRPQEQLAMVLPLESWGLIRDSGLRRLPALMPQMWPRKFGFVSLGRKWLWECEAKIPVLMVERLRA